MRAVFKKIGTHIWAYLAWILVICMFWSWLFGVITSVPKQERIRVFIGTRSSSFERYEELDAACPEYVRELGIDVYAITQSYFSVFLRAFGYEEADILILPESRLQKEYPETLFAEISQEYCSQLPNLGVYEKDGKIYGLLVHDKETHESLISCLDFGQGEDEENYYLLFNRDSMHLGDLSPSVAPSERDGAIVIARRLLSLLDE